jgi:phosphopentomutase
LFKRIIVIVMDSVGIGALPDANEYGDLGADTLGNIARSQGGLFLPSMEKLGLGKIAPLEGGGVPEQVAGWYGKLAEVSRGKDTTTGHWEMAGCPVFQPFPLYPDGFPADVIAAFTAFTGKKVLGNKAASGTEIMQELGQEHVRTGDPIVYTSADSVLQIAAHEDVIPLDELYEMGKKVREKVCVGEHAVGRVIVRPFVGTAGHFARTPNRHDYSLVPPAPTVLDALKDAGKAVIGIGKIGDIFAGRGITASYPTKSNDHGMLVLQELLKDRREEGLIFSNLVEFDSVFGHRNDSRGYAWALQRLDGQLALLLPRLTADELLILTADHGCDPTTAGTDHTREYVPLLVFHNNRMGRSLGTRTSLADISATVAENFSLPSMAYGTSFLKDLRSE